MPVTFPVVAQRLNASTGDDDCALSSVLTPNMPETCCISQQSF
jgi:hypothetical protein